MERLKVLTKAIKLVNPKTFIVVIKKNVPIGGCFFIQPLIPRFRIFEPNFDKRCNCTWHNNSICKRCYKVEIGNFSLTEAKIETIFEHMFRY
jgi:hypothetical protein